MNTPFPDRYLRLDAVLDRTGLSRATLYRKILEGTFPKQVRIARRCAGWRESAISEWQRNPVGYRAADHAPKQTPDQVSDPGDSH